MTFLEGGMEEKTSPGSQWNIWTLVRHLPGDICKTHTHLPGNTLTLCEFRLEKINVPFPGSVQGCCLGQSGDSQGPSL